ncbi:MAG: rRNA maturation RNase YbeY [bacterium]|nr:rRNA maturation RNase YbeY [bacterium]
MVTIQAKYPLPRNIIRKLKKLALAVLLQEKRPSVELSILLTDEKQIMALNRHYFHKRRPTDVIAFPQDDSRILGDIVISVETAEQQATRYGHSLIDELSYLLIHGILHLLKYDDIEPSERRKMRAKEREYLTKFKIEAHPEPD